MTAFNALAILTVFQNVNSGCMWLDHQPEVPEEARRFKRF
ncbi:cyclic lactone autoinducer peptide [bacterium D16-54]|nr:cyclic lactone autoinducer peptide [bacterium D16-54]RKJ15374.1 cyclic lactone autoinducer peptide [bacterium D16-56]